MHHSTFRSLAQLKQEHALLEVLRPGDVRLQEAMRAEFDEALRRKKVTREEWEAALERKNNPEGAKRKAGRA